MKNYNLRIISFLIIATSAIFVTPLTAQNLFDSIHSEQYAHYLFANHEYDLASQEFERVLFLTNYTDDSLKLMCVKSIRLSGKFQLAHRRLLKFYPTLDFTNPVLSKEYLKILYEEKKYSLVQTELNRMNNLDSNDKMMFTLSSLILSKQFKKASTIIEIDTLKAAPFIPIIEYQKNLKYKSPWLAGTLSAIIPGLGQTYAGNWKDGVFALIFTGSSAFQAYRGFHKAGISSPFGWVFTAIGSAFYAANIYGASKAANKHNFLNHVKISIQVGGIMDNYYH